MVIISTITNVGSMGDLKYAHGGYTQSGATVNGNILVPMKRVDVLMLQDIGSGVTSCSGHSRPYGVTFPYNSGASPVNYIPVTTCISGITGLWFAFGKGG